MYIYIYIYTYIHIRTPWWSVPPSAEVEKTNQYVMFCSMLELGIFVSCRHSESIELLFMYVTTCSLLTISRMPLTFNDANLSSLEYFHSEAIPLVSSSYLIGSENTSVSSKVILSGSCCYLFPQLSKPYSLEEWVGPISTHLPGSFL